MCTTNIFSIFEFKKLLEFVYETKLKYLNSERNTAITIDPTILRYPNHQNLSILTDDLKSNLDEALTYMREKQEGTNGNPYYHGFYDFECNRLERLIEFMKTGPHPGDGINLDVARKDFAIFVDEHDRRRSTNFLETFPGLTEFYNLCKSL